MATLCQSPELATRICEVLGLDPGDVKALTLHLEVGRAPTLTVVRTGVGTVDQQEHIADELCRLRYRLEPIDGD